MFVLPMTNDTPAVNLPYSETSHEDTTDNSCLSTANRLNMLFHSTGEDILSKWWVSSMVTGTNDAMYKSQSPAKNESDGKLDSNNLRLRLLAKKYANRYFSTEDEARLTIVTERIKHAVARIDEKDIALLEDASMEIERSRALRARLMKKYGK